MKENNSIINSLKRLERVGSETSVVTQKLKEAVEEIAKKIDEIVRPYVQENDFEPDFETVIDHLHYFCGTLIWDYDGEATPYIYNSYALCPNKTYVSRAVALDFAKAIANGLLENIAKWIAEKKAETEKALIAVGKKE